MRPRRTPALTVTTNGSQAAEAYTVAIHGWLVAVRYTKDGSNGYTDGVDFTITTETTGQNVWVKENVNASETIYPLAQAKDTAGTDITGAASRIPLFGERIKIVLASGGTSKVGTFEVFYEDTDQRN